MLTLGQIVAMLQDRKLDIVSAKTGLHRNTLAAIRDGRNANPTLKTIEALSEYFASQADGISR
jgi:DNA-binding Xre family transcriptional regulator